MARRTISHHPSAFDISKFQNVQQVGGIRTGTLDDPNPGGAGGRGCRVAHVNTGSGLRFVVALDRGGDIVEASYNQHNLAFLTPNGYKLPEHGYHRDLEWLRSWPGGLLTTCGPRTVGGPREEDGETVSLHGTHSNTPAALEMVINPDPHQARHEMLLSMVTTTSRMFGPILELRRQIQCRLGAPEIVIFDQVTNRGDVPVPHNLLYHINLGYPLLDRGAQLIYRGKCFDTWNAPHETKPGKLNLKQIKRVPDGLPEHRAFGERGIVLDVKGDRDGLAHAGLINRKLKLAFQVSWSAQTLPRFANWQHYGPNGSYVTGLEPFSGSLTGKARDTHHTADQWLQPDETRRYHLILKIHDGAKALSSLAALDGEVKSSNRSQAV